MVIFPVNASVWTGEISECSLVTVSDQFLDAVVPCNVCYPPGVAIQFFFVVPWQRARHHDVTAFSWLQAYVG